MRSGLVRQIHFTYSSGLPDTTSLSNIIRDTSINYFFFFFFALLSASVHLLMLEKSFSTRRYYLMKNVTFLVHIHDPKSTVKCSTGSCVIWRSWEQEKSVVISFFFFFSINFDSYNDWQGHFEMTSLLPKL